MLKKPGFWVVFYIVMWIFTFGHAVNSKDCYYTQEYIHSNHTRMYDHCFLTGAVPMWPLYWSAYIQKNFRVPTISINLNR